MTFSAWDFAGQEIYYATHALFLSSNAIYLLVFDLRHPNESRIEFWLNSVASRATGAPAILVGTHLDDPMFEGNQEKTLEILNDINNRYKSRFPNIDTICCVSASEWVGIGFLLDAIGGLAMKMPNIKIPLPRIYQNLEELGIPRFPLTPLSSLPPFFQPLLSEPHLHSPSFSILQLLFFFSIRSPFPTLLYFFLFPPLSGKSPSTPFVPLTFPFSTPLPAFMRDISAQFIIHARHSFTRLFFNQ